MKKKREEGVPVMVRKPRSLSSSNGTGDLSKWLAIVRARFGSPTVTCGTVDRLWAGNERAREHVLGDVRCDWLLRRA